MTKYKQMPLGTIVKPGDRITVTVTVPESGGWRVTPGIDDVRSIERPIPEVELPTVPGYYTPKNQVYIDTPLTLFRNGEWVDGYGRTMSEERLHYLMPLTRLVPETAPVKLADRIDVYKLADVMKREYHGSSECWNEDAAAIIAAIDNGELDK